MLFCSFEKWATTRWMLPPPPPAFFPRGRDEGTTYLSVLHGTVGMYASDAI